MQYKIIDGFSPSAKALRSAFERKFANPRETKGQRFVWDYWHVPDQYTLLRTPAHAYFPRAVYLSFHRQLVEWGRENLGCHDVSPPWLSCYVEGCRQELHCDVPHGPLAFVFSLSPWNRRVFTGGETVLLKDSTLNFWSNVSAGFERSDLVDNIPAKFNRLVVFNPAIPHGVNEVRGTHDPREGRLVIHGWFVNPRPFWYGPLNAQAVSKGIEAGLGQALSGGLQLGRGLLSVRLSITPAGRVRQLRFLISTLVGADDAALKKLRQDLKRLQFAKRTKGTELTLPLLVE